MSINLVTGGAGFLGAHLIDQLMTLAKKLFVSTTFIQAGNLI